jgi:hypothetical protein
MIPPPPWWRIFQDHTIGVSLALFVLGIILLMVGVNDYLLFLAIGMLLGRMSSIHDR